MSVHQDRRDAKSVRIPFEAIVEIGGDLPEGAAFEAQSIDLSVSGMHLRTAYLPAVGQALFCRFGSGAEDISAEAEVMWRREESRGGEFGIRFSNLDGASTAALCQMCGLGSSASSDEESQGDAPPGTRVRLHIDGLGSPMKARVRGATDSELLVGSNLEFLRVGRQLELEDVDRGGKRPAHIDRVDIEVDRESRVPQLVVTLRYDDVDAAGGRTGKGPKGGSRTADASQTARPAKAEEEASSRSIAMLRRGYDLARARWTGSRVVRAARRFGSSMSRWSGCAKTTAALLWTRTIERSKGEPAARARRTTSPPPTGALHATGKRVVREAATEDTDDTSMSIQRPRLGRGTMLVAVGASVLALIVLVIVLARKSPATAGLAATAASDAKTTAAAPADPALAVNPAPFADAGVASAASTPTDPGPAAHVEPVDDTKTSAAPAEPNATLTLVPTFGSGKVTHAVIVQVKMDGPIGAFHGIRTANGFTVTMPGRRTLDRGTLLGRADPRLASVKVVNHAKGTELTFEFRSSVPAYLVRARGDRLQVALGQSVAAASSHGPIATRTSGAEHARADHRSLRSNGAERSTDKAPLSSRRP